MSIMESPQDKSAPSFREQRIRKITHLYYSRKDIQNAIYTFSKNREISPRYFEGFGKRPDSFQYLNDVFEMAKKGATSFHCSEELWSEPLNIVTGMNEEQLNELRIGWDLLIDIDSKYIDYSKISAQIIINMLKFHGIKNIGVKFSGNKGFHIIVPWKAFPKEINKVKTSDMFPEYPRIITQYLMAKTKEEITGKINKMLHGKDEFEFIKKYIKRDKGSREILDTVSSLKITNKASMESYRKIDSIKDDEGSWTKEVLPDIILVSPRHLFRTPYSLHEKTALASVVLNTDEIEGFQLKDADPLKAKIKDFMPDSKEGEASKLLMQALDWHKEQNFKSPEKSTGKFADFKPIQLTNLSDSNFPPCVQKILNGMDDGKKRATFVLINLFRSVGMDKVELEKKIYDWNKKNNKPLNEGYIKSQLSWAYRKKPVMPPNCKEFYQGIAACIPDDFCKLIKNPVNYTIRKNFQANRNQTSNKKPDANNKFKK